MGFDDVYAVMLGAGLVLGLWLVSWICARALHHFASLFHSEPVVRREVVFRHPEVEGLEIREVIIDAEVVDDS
jgi:hypothetical protein